LVEPDPHELDRREPAVGAKRPVHAVVDAPVRLPRKAGARTHFSERCPITRERHQRWHVTEHRLRVAIIRVQAQCPLTIAGNFVGLTAPADVCFNDTERKPAFGILSCEFIAQDGISGTRDETWVQRMLGKVGIALYLLPI
jgi:hypothetical protein